MTVEQVSGTALPSTGKTLGSVPGPTKNKTKNTFLEAPYLPRI